MERAAPTAALQQVSKSRLPSMETEGFTLCYEQRVVETCVAQEEL